MNKIGKSFRDSFSPSSISDITSSRATHSITDNARLINKVAVGETVILPITKNGKELFYEVTNQGTLSDLREARNLGSGLDIFYKMTGLKKSDANDAKLQSYKRDKNFNIFQFKPHNGVARSTNSSHELSYYKGNKRLAEEKDLSDVMVNTISYGSAVEVGIKEFFVSQGLESNGVSFLYDESGVKGSEELLTKAEEDNKFFEVVGTDASTNRKTANAIAKSDTVYMALPLLKTSYAVLKEKLDLKSKLTLTKNENQLKKAILKHYETKGFFGETRLTEELGATIMSEPEARDLAKKLKYTNFAEFFTMAKRIVDSAESKAETPVELKEKTLSQAQTYSLQMAKEAAATSDTPLFVYDTREHRWKQYNTKTGFFNPVAIPLISSSPLLLGDFDNTSHTQGFEGLLLKKGFNTLEAKFGLPTPQDITSLASLGSADVNSEISEITATNEAALKGYEFGKSFTPEGFSEQLVTESIEQNGKEVLVRSKVQSVEGKLGSIIKNQFLAWDEDTVIAKRKDGSITIEGSIDGRPQFMVAMSKELSDSYGGFAGDGINERNDFAFSVGETYYLFDTVLVTDKQTFERRDQLKKERTKIQKMYSEAELFFQKEVLPLYKEVRFNSEFADNYFLSYGNSYKSFMLFLSTGSENNLDPSQKEDLQALLSKHSRYHKMHTDASDYKYKVRRENEKNITVNSYEGSFFDIGTDGDVLVHLTDSANQHNEGVARKALGHQTKVLVAPGKPTRPGAFTHQKQLKSFSVGVTNSDGNLTSKAYIYSNIKALIDRAKKDNTKTFYMELPIDGNGNVYGKVTAVEFAIIMARQLSNYGTPLNLKFSSEFSSLLKEVGSGVDPKKINRTVPFRFTNDMFEGAFDVTQRYSPVYTKWEGERSILEEWNARRGYPTGGINAAAVKGSMLYGDDLKQAYKHLWREWAIKNPTEFNKLATNVGSRSIYDARVSAERGSFSTGQVLAELLTEKFVDNSWVDLPKSTYEAKLNEGQTFLAVPVNHGITLDKTTKKGLVSIDGKTYIVRVYGSPDKAFDDTKLFELEATQLGLDFSQELLPQIREKYNFMTAKNARYTVLSLEESVAELQRTKPVDAGTFIDQLSNIGNDEESDSIEGKLNEQEIYAASNATIQFGFDYRRRVTDGDSGFATGTPWMDERKSKLGFGIVTDKAKSSDVVWMYGTRSTDKVNALNIQKMFASAQPFVDKYARAGATILVGKKGGMDEQIRAYVVAKYPNYTETENGLVFSPIKKSGSTLTVFKKSKNSIARFNSNNTSNREANGPGAQGTVLYTDKNAAPGAEKSFSYELSLDSDLTGVADWKGVSQGSAVELADFISTIGKVESDSDFSKIRESLLVREQVFAQRLVQLAVLKELKINAPSNSLESFDTFVSRQKEINTAFRSELIVQMALVFDENNSFKEVSDVGKLAMIRNRFIANNYLQDLNPLLKLTPALERTNAYKLISTERNLTDKSSAYARIMKTNSIGESDLTLIREADKVNNRDIYNFLMTFGPFRNSDFKGALNAGAVNEYFVNKGVVAFKEGDKLTLLDNSMVKPAQAGGVSDINTSQGNMLTRGEEKFAKTDSLAAYSFKYLRKNNLISFDEENNTFTLTLDGVTTYENNRKSVYEAINKLKAQILNNYLTTIEGISFDAEFIAEQAKDFKLNSLKSLLDGHIRFDKFLDKNMFEGMFKRKGKEPLATNRAKLDTFTNYTFRDQNVIVIEDNNKEWFAQSEDGTLFKLSNKNMWEAVPDINNAKSDMSAGIQNGLANPRGVGRVFSKLLTVTDVYHEGEFIVSETVSDNDGIIERVTEATDEDGRVWQWNAVGKKAWVPTDNAVSAVGVGLGGFNLETSFKVGQTVLSLKDIAGTISLYNGKAITETKVEDDKGTYEFNPETGGWIATFKGGFTNPNVKFQNEPLDLSEFKTEGHALKSRTTSPVMMRKMVAFLNEKLGVEIEMMSTQDIEVIFGKMYKDASAFVTPEGRVVLNSDNATMDTPLHEVIGHVYMDNLKKNDPDAYSKIVKLALSHPIANKIAKSYPHLNQEQLGEEVFATLFGLSTQEMFENAVLEDGQKESTEDGIWRSIKKAASGFTAWFNNLFSNMFGIDTKNTEFKIDTSLSLFGIIEQLGHETVFGDGSFFESVNADTNKTMSDLLSNFTESDIFDKLGELGLITIVCV